jgi:hypothetical protein
VPSDFTQLDWSPAIDDDLRQIVRLAVREDLDRHLRLIRHRQQIRLYQLQRPRPDAIHAQQVFVIGKLPACVT